MTAFIKNRGDRDPKDTINRISELPSFKAMVEKKQKDMAEIKAQRDGSRRDFKAEKAHMREEDRVRDVINDTAQVIKSHGELGLNDCKTFEDARKKAEQIAYKEERKQAGE